MTYDNIKSHKKAGRDPLSLSLSKIPFWKNHREVKLTPSLFRVKPPSNYNLRNHQKYFISPMKTVNYGLSALECLGLNI